jgi:hypothetical protein
MTTFARNRAQVGSGPGFVARRSLWEVARIVRLITMVVVGLIVVGIALVLFEANRDNGVVDWLLGAAEFLTEPFDNVFDADDRKTRIGVNWGLAAVVYAIAGGVIVRLLRR